MSSAYKFIEKQLAERGLVMRCADAAELWPAPFKRLAEAFESKTAAEEIAEALNADPRQLSCGVAVPTGEREVTVSGTPVRTASEQRAEESDDQLKARLVAKRRIGDLSGANRAESITRIIGGQQWLDPEHTHWLVTSIATMKVGANTYRIATIQVPGSACKAHWRLNDDDTVPLSGWTLLSSPVEPGWVADEIAPSASGGEVMLTFGTFRNPDAPPSEYDGELLRRLIGHRSSVVEFPPLPPLPDIGLLPIFAAFAESTDKMVSAAMAMLTSNLRASARTCTDDPCYCDPCCIARAKARQDAAVMAEAKREVNREPSDLVKFTRHLLRLCPPDLDPEGWRAVVLAHVERARVPPMGLSPEMLAGNLLRMIRREICVLRGGERVYPYAEIYERAAAASRLLGRPANRWWAG